MEENKTPQLKDNMSQAELAAIAEQFEDQAQNEEIAAGKKKKKKEELHVYIILYIVMAVLAIMTYIVPAGNFDRYVNENGINVVDPMSYHQVEKTPTSLRTFLTAAPKGYVNASDIIFMNIAAGIMMQVLNEIGVIPRLVRSTARKYRNKRAAVIPLFVLLFAIIDTFIGTPELCLVYVSIIMPIMFSLGFDSMTTAAVVLAGEGAGWISGITNPFNTVVAQRIAEVPLYSAWGFRVIMLVVFAAIAVIYVSAYAKKILKDPTKSLTYESDAEKRQLYASEEAIAATLNQEKATLGTRLAGIFAILAVLFMIYNVLTNGWDMPEMSATFIVIAVVGGVLSGMKGNEICRAAVRGGEFMVFPCLILGIGFGISVVMTSGNITDTIVNVLAQAVNGLPTIATLLLILLFICCLDPFFSISVGKALVILPILVPLGDVVGIKRQVMVLLYQMGDGVMNYVEPMCGWMMAALATAGVPYGKWMKFFFPVAIMWIVASAVLLVVAQLLPSVGPY